MTAFRDETGREFDRWSYRAPGPLEDDDRARAFERFLSDEAGHPLGAGMPTGSPLRKDDVWHAPSQSWRGESHLMAWERICRGDPCAFCGQVVSFSQAKQAWLLGAGTVDHIEPKTLPVRLYATAHSWLNVAGACEQCNGGKARKKLWHYLWVRSRSRRVRPARRVGSLRGIPDQEEQAC